MTSSLRNRVTARSSLWVALLICSCFQSLEAQAQGITTQRLVSSCESAIRGVSGSTNSRVEAERAATCLPYIAGYFDALAYSEVVAGAKQWVCPPERGLTYEQAARAFLRYMEDNRKDMDKPSRHNLFFALISAYPC